MNPLIGKLAYKNHNGLFGGLVGVVEKNNSPHAISPYILVTPGARIGAYAKDLVIVDDEEIKED